MMPTYQYPAAKSIYMFMENVEDELKIDPTPFAFIYFALPNYNERVIARIDGEQKLLIGKNGKLYPRPLFDAWEIKIAEVLFQGFTLNEFEMRMNYTYLNRLFLRSARCNTFFQSKKKLNFKGFKQLAISALINDYKVPSIIASRIVGLSATYLEKNYRKEDPFYMNELLKRGLKITSQSAGSD